MAAILSRFQCINRILFWITVEMKYESHTVPQITYIFICNSVNSRKMNFYIFVESYFLYDK